MAVTSPDDLWTPDSGDDYALTTDLAAGMDSVQDAFKVRANYYVGTTAQRTAAVSDAEEGAMWYDVDLSTEYRLDTGAWVEIEQPNVGNKLVTPTSVAGTGVSLSGATINFASASEVSVNGCFTSEYNSYIINIVFTAHASSDTLMRMRDSGTNDSTATYLYRLTGSQGAGTLETDIFVSQNEWAIDDTSGIGSPTSGRVKLEMSNPAVAAETLGIGTHATSGTSNISLGQTGFSKDGSETFDGFHIYLASGTMSGTIQIYGLAQ